MGRVRADIPWDEDEEIVETTIICDEARTALSQLPGKSVRCCVTSPPYYALRDYGGAPVLWADGWTGCLGREDTVAAYVAHLSEVLDAVRRVLTDDGTLWLNMGDGFARAPGKGARFPDTGMRERGRTDSAPLSGNLKPKDMMGVPWTVALALRDAGWYLRGGIPWIKRNITPAPLIDRPTTGVEYIFLLAKNSDYYYDREAIKVAATGMKPGNKRRVFSHQPGDNQLATSVPGWENADGRRLRRDTDWFFDSIRACLSGDGVITDEAGGATAYVVNNKPVKGKHTAVFPPNMVLPCVMAGSATGDTILDPFAGSGTVGVVAKACGRSSILIEQQEAFIPLLRQRVAEAHAPPAAAAETAMANMHAQTTIDILRGP